MSQWIVLSIIVILIDITVESLNQQIVGVWIKDEQIQAIDKYYNLLCIVSGFGKNVDIVGLLYSRKII
jgi:hypothetical protein